jgi:hypothetical protein
MKPGTLNLLEPSRPVQGLLYIFLPFTLFFNSQEELSLGNATTNGRIEGNNVGLPE